jgi:adenylate cyclase class 1
MPTPNSKAAGETKPTATAPALDGVLPSAEQLANIEQQFFKINTLRLARVTDSLNTEQKIFIELLPVLFHLNHPSLPGFIDERTAAGVHGFRITRQHIRLARQLDNNFNLLPGANNTSDIRAIYLMGSCGSLGHSSQSDMDIWVVPRSNLDAKTQHSLQSKCTAITEWAQQLGLEVHFFIMDDAAFRARERAGMDEEDCGSTQHYLLLDEFYRTSILIVGQPPLWWLVPAQHDHEYNQYVDELTANRQLPQSNYVDFGSTNAIPAAEFVSAGVWHLYKALGSPYKALIKLLLIEVYAGQYPDTRSLCNQFKHSVYSGDFDVDALDPYLLIFRRIEQYLLARSETDRLELLRRCLYFKAGVKLSRAGTAQNNCATQPWKQLLMIGLVAEWGWSEQQLERLDQKEQWPYQDVQAEQTKLIRELINSYRMLCVLVKNQADPGGVDHNNSKELTLLGRQLYAAFEQKPHKIPMQHCAVVNDHSKATAKFWCDNKDPENPLWCLDIPVAKDDQNKSSPSPQSETVRKASNIVELIAWSTANRLTDKATSLKIAGSNHTVSESELKQLHGIIQQQVIHNEKQDSYDAIKKQFAKPARIAHCSFIIRNNDQTDTGAAPESITMIAINNWNEVYCQHYLGDSAIDSCLIEYFSLLAASDAAHRPTRNFYSASSNGVKMINRIEQLFDDINSCYFSEKSLDNDDQQTHFAQRYIYETGSQYSVFHWQHKKPVVHNYRNSQHLLSSFSGDVDYGKAVIDRLTLTRHPLSAVARKLEASISQASAGHFHDTRRENKVRIFYEVIEKIAHTYLVDQHQALGYAQIPFESTRAFILPLARFVEQSSLRRAMSTQPSSLASSAVNVDQDLDLEASVNQVQEAIARIGAIDTFSGNANARQLPDIEFYALNKNEASSDHSYSTLRVPTESDIGATYLSIKAVGTKASSGDIHWTIFCNDETFDQTLHGKALFEKVAESIMQRRQSKQQRYRCYITDIEITGRGISTTDNDSRSDNLIRDFYFKNQLEESLNEALLALPD